MKVIALLLLLVSFASPAQTNYFDVLVERMDQLIIEQPEESLFNLMYSAYRQDPELRNENIPANLSTKLAIHYSEQILKDVNQKYNSQWRIEAARTDSNKNKFIYSLVYDQQAGPKLEAAIEAISDDNIKKAAEELREYAKYSRLQQPLLMGLARGVGVEMIAVPIGLFANFLVNIGGALTYPYTGSADFTGLVVAVPFIATFVTSTIMDIVKNKNALNSQEKLLGLLREQVKKVSQFKGSELLAADIKKIKKALKKAGAKNFFKSIDLYQASNQARLKLTLDGKLGTFNWSNGGKKDMSYRESLESLEKVTEWFQSYNDCSSNYKS